jgi:hypothetical protein
LGCNLFTPLRSRGGRRFSKNLLCPALPHNLAGFLSVSPEAYLLTGKLLVNL